MLVAPACAPQVLFFLFSGYLIPWEDLSKGWWLVQWSSPQSFAYAALILNEFNGQSYNCTPEERSTLNGTCVYTSGDEWLMDKGFNTDINVWVYLGVLGVLCVIYFLLAGICLHNIRHQKRVIQVEGPTRTEPSGMIFHLRLGQRPR